MIKSNIVKNTLREVGAENINFVEDLLLIEKFVLSPPRQYTSGMKDQSLRNNYPTLYTLILQELNPTLYREDKKQEQKRKKAIKKIHKESKKRDSILKKEVLGCL